MTGIILSGGKNTRMGTNKAFLEVCGERLIDRTVRLFRELFDEVIVVTNEPLLYLSLDVTVVTDVMKGKGALGGIYSGIFYASSHQSFIAACDMPFLCKPFIEHMIANRDNADIVIPEKMGGGTRLIEPLHAVYAKTCLAPIRSLLVRNELKISGFFKGLRMRVIPEDTVKRFDPCGRMFMNVNTKQDLDGIRNPPEYLNGRKG